MKSWQVRKLGGPGSGHFGHASQPGKRGGSLPRSSAMSLKTGRDWEQRQKIAKGSTMSPEFERIASLEKEQLMRSGIHDYDPDYIREKAAETILEGSFSHEEALEDADIMEKTGGSRFSGMGWEIKPAAIRDAVKVIQDSDAKFIRSETKPGGKYSVSRWGKSVDIEHKPGDMWQAIYRPGKGKNQVESGYMRELSVAEEWAKNTLRQYYES